ncbi:type II toxin-antitoxin system RnlB family antitoxin [Vibrio breoganii]
MISIRQLRLNNEALTLATATSYESPLSNLSEISQALVSKLNAKPQLVLFDLLCSNGDEWNRFIAMEFDGRQLIRNTFKVIGNDDISLHGDLKQLQTAYFDQNPHILKASILT